MATNQFNPIPTQLAPYGQVVIDGQPYIERHQVFAFEQRIDTPAQTFTGLRLTMPGVANFLLKGLGRDFTVPGDSISHNRIFRFRIVNSEATTWFFAGGLGIFDDRIFDTLVFGNAQFPFPIIPPVPVHANGSLVFEIEDIDVTQLVAPAIAYPYVLHIAFYGNYLIPATGSGAGIGPLAFNGGKGIVGAT